MFLKQISSLIITASLLVTFMAAGIFYSCSSDEYNDAPSVSSEMPDDQPVTYKVTHKRLSPGA